MTAIQRGVASTRWHDFGDLYLVSRKHSFEAGQLRGSIEAVSGHRKATLVLLADALPGYTAIGQTGWPGWRSRLNLEESLPELFAETLAVVFAFVDPILSGDAGPTTAWSPETLIWA